MFCGILYINSWGNSIFFLKLLYKSCISNAIVLTLIVSLSMLEYKIVMHHIFAVWYSSILQTRNNQYYILITFINRFQIIFWICACFIEFKASIYLYWIYICVFLILIDVSKEKKKKARNSVYGIWHLWNYIVFVKHEIGV